MKVPIRLSAEAGDLIDDFANAFVEIASATQKDVGSKQAADAYVAMTMRRKELAEYISRLEWGARIPQQVKVFQVGIP